MDEEAFEQSDPSNHDQGNTTSPELPPTVPAVGLVSYGPATRRRLTSMHRRNPTIGGGESFVPQTHSPLAPLGIKRVSSAGSRGLVNQPLSESPDERGHVAFDDQAGSPPEGRQQRQAETVTQMQSEEEGAGVGGVMVDRLRRIEERQKRMEEILMKLAEKMDS